MYLNAGIATIANMRYYGESKIKLNKESCWF